MNGGGGVQGLGKFMFSFFNQKSLFIKPSILLALPAVSLHMLGEFGARNICNAKVFDVLYTFEFSAIHLIIKFLVSCTYL